jgi:hypothetical protein
MMGDVKVLCPDCGGAISHSCGAIPAQTLAQSDRNPDANTGAISEFAHDSGSSDLVLFKESKRYNQGYDQDFLKFWTIYPLKRDKRKAEKAWRNSVRRLGANPGANREAAMAQILAGAIRYRDDPNRVDEFTKYAEGWLNGDGWEDEALPSRNGRGPGSGPDRTRLALERLKEKRS